MIDILYVSDFGIKTSYAEVAYQLINFLIEEGRYDTHVLSIGCSSRKSDDEMHTEILRYIPRLDLKKVHFVKQMEQLKSANTYEKEYILNNDWGIIELPKIVRNFKPRLIISLGDDRKIRRQLESLEFCYHAWGGKFIPYLPIDLMMIYPEWINFLYDVDGVITLADFAKNEILKSLGFNKPIYTLPLSSNPQNFYEMDKEECRKKWAPNTQNSFILISNSMNTRRKRWDLFVRAVDEAKKKCRDLYLIIKTNTRRQLISTFEQGFNAGYDFDQLIAGRESWIQIITDHLSIQDLNELYNCANLGVSTTSGEGWGLTPCEMALAGVPSLLPNFTSFSEIFESNYPGFVRHHLIPWHVGRYLPAFDDKFEIIAQFYRNHRTETHETEMPIAHSSRAVLFCVSPARNLNLEQYAIAKQFSSICELVEFLKRLEFKDELPDVFELVLQAGPRYAYLIQHYKRISEIDFIFKPKNFSTIQISNKYLDAICTSKYSVVCEVDPLDISSKIIYYYRNPDALNEMKTAAKNCILNKYHPARIKAIWLQILDTLIEKN